LRRRVPLFRREVPDRLGWAIARQATLALDKPFDLKGRLRICAEDLCCVDPWNDPRVSLLADAMDWLVRPTTAGTSADTPYSLRLKAAEFLRLSAETKNPVMREELGRLAASYLDGARKLERANTRAIQPKDENVEVGPTQG
jgi:hypothetical protein